MAKRGVYTGSFDPVTLGHLHIIRRASGIFDELIIGIGINTDKRALFDTQQRVDLLEKVTQEFENVKILTFDGLAVDFVRLCDANVMVRGIRPLTDIAGEFTMMMANRQLDDRIETVFLMADEEYSHISSSLLKQIAALSESDDRLMKFVPKEVIPDLRKRLAE